MTQIRPQPVSVLNVDVLNRYGIYHNPRHSAILQSRRTESPCVTGRFRLTFDPRSVILSLADHGVGSRSQRLAERCPSWPKEHDWKSCKGVKPLRGFESH